MAGPIYVIWRLRLTEAFLQLSKEEQESFWAKRIELGEKVGEKPIIMLDTYWSTEHWHMAGVTEFPDLDALQKFEKLSLEMNKDLYMSTEIMLGTKLEQPS